MNESSARPNRFQNARVISLTALARRAQTGDREALASFVEHSQVDVWRYCAYLTDSRSADDVTQDTFVRAIGSMHRFRGDGDAKVWLLSIARRAAADHLRARNRRRDLVERLRVGVASDDAIGASSSVEMTELLAGLDADRRDAFVLTQVLGLSYDEAAHVCRCPIGTIRSRVARARADLVSAIDDIERATGT